MMRRNPALMERTRREFLSEESLTQSFSSSSSSTSPSTQAASDVNATAAGETLRAMFQGKGPLEQNWKWTPGSNPCAGYTEAGSYCCATDYSFRRDIPGCLISFPNKCPWKWVSCRDGAPVALTYGFSDFDFAHGELISTEGLNLTLINSIPTIEYFALWSRGKFTGPLIATELDHLKQFIISGFLSIDVVNDFWLKTRDDFPQMERVRIYYGPNFYGDFGRTTTIPPFIVSFRNLDNVTGTVVISEHLPWNKFIWTNVPHMTVDISADPANVFTEVEQLEIGNTPFVTGGKPLADPAKGRYLNLNETFKITSAFTDAANPVAFDFAALQGGPGFHENRAEMEISGNKGLTGTVDWAVLGNLFPFDEEAEFRTELKLMDNQFTGTIDLQALLSPSGGGRSSISTLDLSGNLWDESNVTDQWQYLKNAPYLFTVNIANSKLTGSMDEAWKQFNSRRAYRNYITLNSNTLTGDAKYFPDAIQGDFGLEGFEIRSNQFHCRESGVFPWKRMFSEVNRVVIDDNQFTGTVDWDAVATAKGKLNTRIIDVSRNQFNGTVNWDAMASAPELRGLQINDNAFTGAIDLGKVRHFRQIDVSNNELSGEVDLSSVASHDAQLFSLFLKQKDPSALCFTSYVDLSAQGWYGGDDIDFSPSDPRIIDPELGKVTDLTDDFISNNLCTTNPTNPSSSTPGPGQSNPSANGSHKTVVVGSVVGALVLIAVVVLGLVLYRRHKRSVEARQMWTEAEEAGVSTTEMTGSARPMNRSSGYESTA